MAASIARFARLVATAIRGYRARRRVRYLIELDFQLLQGSGAGRAEIERLEAPVGHQSGVNRRRE